LKYITIRQIAKAAGVSLSTTSRALNGKIDVSEETRKKVLETAKKLGYLPNRSAVSLKKQKTYTIGVVVEDNSNPFWSEVLKGIENAARKEGYHVIFTNTNRNYQNEVENIKLLLERRVDGFLIVPNQEKYDDLQELKERDIPLVIMGRHVENLKIPMVYTDDVKGGYTATSYLISRGCRKIAFIGAQPYNTASIERCEGYKKALREGGIKVDGSLIKISKSPMENGVMEVENAYRHMKELLDEKTDFDAVFAYNDLMAFGALRALKEAKIPVPEQVKLIGYDDIFYASIITPSLTTMRTKKQVLGEIAFELLFNPKERVVLNSKLLVRESA
jgi:LacI family transcriptional regulator